MRMQKGKPNTERTVLITLALTVLILILIICGILAARRAQHRTMLALYPRHYQAIVENNALAYDIPKELLYAIIRTESSFDPDAESHAGARGLMQLMPHTYEWIAWRLEEPHNPSLITEPGHNIRYGCYLLSYFYQKYENWDHVLAAYNAGDGNVDKWLNDPAYCQNGKLVAIPFPETSQYLQKIRDAWDIYIELYPNETE